jgi:hypothetical protein
MHRGRGYPQILDRMLSPDALVPWWAPERVVIGGFLDMLLTLPGPFTTITGPGVVDYPSRSITWTSTFSWFFYVVEVSLTQSILSSPQHGVEFLIVYRSAIAAHVSFRQIETRQNWLWFTELGPYLWPIVAIFPPFNNAAVSIVYPQRYY